MISINKPFTIYYKAALRDGAFVEITAKDFLDKNAALIERFSKRDQRLIRGQFYENVAVSHKANNNRAGFLRAEWRSLCANPFRRPGAYLELIESALGIRLLEPLARLFGRSDDRSNKEQTP
jgi:hypothetical protein